MGDEEKGIGLGLYGWVFLQSLMFIAKYSIAEKMPWLIVFSPTLFVVGVVMLVIIIVLIGALTFKLPL